MFKVNNKDIRTTPLPYCRIKNVAVLKKRFYSFPKFPETPAGKYLSAQS